MEDLLTIQRLFTFSNYEMVQLNRTFKDFIGACSIKSEQIQIRANFTSRA